ncbi:MAG: phosphoribosylanthranilate isomerase [Melioribacteraceae bacterium]|nr:phosphoribosylanthranilate isomerase [Melioribacteraceae bacterium]
MRISKIKVKICCISSSEEAMLAIKYGADAVGLVSSMPSGPGVIEDEKISEIAALIPPGIDSFLLTSKQNVNEIVKQHGICRTKTIQLCDRLLYGTYRELKERLPGISIVQVVHVTDKSSVDEACSLSGNVDAILLDSGNQKLKIKELGGTGRTHDWELSRQIVQLSGKPVFLAGGLNSENVVDAVNIVKPYGVDLCSGVRTNGKLNEDKLTRFFKSLRVFSHNGEEENSGV